MKSHCWLFLKIAIAAALIYFLFQQDSITVGALGTLLAHPFAMLVVAALFLANLLVGTLRWKWLLDALNIQASYRTLVDISFIGTFGNVFLPGGTGGDALRAYYVTRLAPDARGNALLSLVADRLLGVFGLMILTIGMSVVYFSRFAGDAHTSLFIQITFGLFLLFLAAGLGVIVLAGRFNLRQRLKDFKKESLPVKILVHILEVMVTFRSKLKTVFACVVLSLIIQLGLVCSIAVLGYALSMGDLTSLEYMAAGSFSMLANAIPLTPGGIGIGESAFDYFCRALSDAPEAVGYASIFFSFRIITLCLSLIGGWRFITYRASHT